MTNSVSTDKKRKSNRPDSTTILHTKPLRLNSRSLKVSVECIQEESSNEGSDVCTCELRREVSDSSCSEAESVRYRCRQCPVHSASSMLAQSSSGWYTDSEMVDSDSRSTFVRQTHSDVPCQKGSDKINLRSPPGRRFEDEHTTSKKTSSCREHSHQESFVKSREKENIPKFMKPSVLIRLSKVPVSDVPAKRHNFALQKKKPAMNFNDSDERNSVK